jgi:serine/threonine protein phosphatase PrpC
MKFSVYQVSRKGGRPLNEDRLGYTYTRRAVLLVLADGMGGHPEGEKAAEIAVRVFTRQFVALAQPALKDPRAFLEATLLEANQAIVDFADSQSMEDNPRTTLVAAVIQDGVIVVVHSGDSRLYWVRQGHLIRRTRDHSYKDKPELFREVPSGVSRNVLFTCLGSDDLPLFDTFGPAELLPGDRLVLCSDGLWSMWSDDNDLAASVFGMPIRDVVNALADEAVSRAGLQGDNVSLIGLEWDSSDAFEPTQVIEADHLNPRSFASSFGALAPDDWKAIDDFDDAAIERSIAEINEAIRRTAPRKRPS